VQARCIDQRGFQHMARIDQCAQRRDGCGVFGTREDGEEECVRQRFLALRLVVFSAARQRPRRGIDTGKKKLFGHPSIIAHGRQHS